MHRRKFLKLIGAGLTCAPVVKLPENRAAACSGISFGVPADISVAIPTLRLAPRVGSAYGVTWVKLFDADSVQFNVNSDPYTGTWCDGVKIRRKMTSVSILFAEPLITACFF